MGQRLQRDLSAVTNKRLTWGFDSQADVAVTNLELTAHGLRMNLKIPYETIAVEVPGWAGLMPKTSPVLWLVLWLAVILSRRFKMRYASSKHRLGGCKS